MRQMSANIKALLATENYSTFFLVKIVTPNGVMLDTTFPVPVTIVGIGTFTPSELANVDPPRLSEAVDRESYKLTYIDANFQKIAMFESGLTGSNVTVYVGFINTTSAPLGGAQPGHPLLNAEDLLIAYAGVVDTQGYTIDAQEGTVVALIECSSPVAALGLSRTFRTSQEDMKRFSGTDTAFNQVFVDGSKLPWGKA
jgi:hypothetical protein